MGTLGTGNTSLYAQRTPQKPLERLFAEQWHIYTNLPTHSLKKAPRPIGKGALVSFLGNTRNFRGNIVSL